MVSLYIMAASYPFIDLQIVADALNAPLVDVVAVIAFTAWVLRLVWFAVVDRRELKQLVFPGWPLLVVWLVATGFSIFNSWDIAMSFKYWLRPLAFFYLVYVVYVVNVLRRPVDLWRLLFIVYAVGVVAAIYGLYGFALHPGPSIIDKRVIPVALWGISPLGGNQNIIADIMVTTIPIGFFLMLHMKKISQQKLVFGGLVLMIIVNLATFSRSGWLALLLELLILVALQYRHHLKQAARYSVAVLVMALPVTAYMLYFSLQAPVQSSNENRLILNDVALEMFQEYPLFGQGPGTFIPTLERNRVYIEEFGAPLDSHGIIQKVGSELGVVGLVAYFSMSLFVLWKVFSAYRKQSLDSDWAYLLVSLLMMVAGTLFFQLFQTSYYVAKLWFPIGLAVSAVAMVSKQQGYSFDKREKL